MSRNVFILENGTSTLETQLIPLPNFFHQFHTTIKLGGSDFCDFTKYPFVRMVPN